jgi:hypothetical protein
LTPFPRTDKVIGAERAARLVPELGSAVIVNPYAVLDAFLTLLRLLVGLFTLLAGAAAWRRSLSAPTPEARTAVEDQSYLLYSLALLLLALNLLSWPLLYLLLQSYVPQWPGVMCVYGVTQVGTGSLGPARFLPGLLRALQLAKPALVFLGGLWLVLYLLNRRTRTAPLTPRVLGVVTLLGLFAVADAAAEGAYLVIPKQEEFPSAGCCSEAFDRETSSARFLPPVLLRDQQRPWLWGAYYAVNGAMVLGLWHAARRARSGDARLDLALLLAGAAVALPVSAAFLVEVVAPTLLHLPYHHCPYDLIPEAPESLVGVALFFLGSGCVGWAFLADRLGRGEETRAFLPAAVGRLLGLALFGYLGSLVLMSVEVALA